jgi:hypothetical protein
MNRNHNGHFHTSDTAFAAWLVSAGVKLVDVNTTITPAEITLQETDKGQIGELTIAWESGKAEGNVVQFHKTYRYLLRRIHE